MTPLEAIQKIQQMFSQQGMLPVADAPAAQMAEESAEPIESVKEYVLVSGLLKTIAATASLVVMTLLLLQLLARVLQ